MSTEAVRVADDGVVAGDAKPPRGRRISRSTGLPETAHGATQHSFGTRGMTIAGLYCNGVRVALFATTEIQHVVRWMVFDGVRPGVPPFTRAGRAAAGASSPERGGAYAQDVRRVRPSD
jgi:hypothetical protein